MHRRGSFASRARAAVALLLLAPGVSVALADGEADSPAQELVRVTTDEMLDALDNLTDVHLREARETALTRVRRKLRGEAVWPRLKRELGAADAALERAVAAVEASPPTAASSQPDPVCSRAPRPPGASPRPGPRAREAARLSRRRGKETRTAESVEDMIESQRTAL